MRVRFLRLFFFLLLPLLISHATRNQKQAIATPLSSQGHGILRSHAFLSRPAMLKVAIVASALGIRMSERPIASFLTISLGLLGAISGGFSGGDFAENNQLSYVRGILLGALIKGALGALLGFYLSAPPPRLLHAH